MYKDGVVDLQKFIDYASGFQNIVIWGAGNLGTVVGRKLIEIGGRVTPSIYWDKQANSIKTLNGIDVVEPFTSDLAKEDTLLIVCINKKYTTDNWITDIADKHGFHNYILGQGLYESLICPQKIGQALDYNLCVTNKDCSVVTCNKLRANFDVDELLLIGCGIAITKRCTLRCKHCLALVPYYSDKNKVIFSFEEIKVAIDTFFENIGINILFSIASGEPLLHPELADIIAHALKKENLVKLRVVTNGVGKITDKVIEILKNDRVILSFSNYTNFLNEEQTRLFNKNVELVKTAGINYIVDTPQWYIPIPPKDYNYTEEELRIMKSDCTDIKLCSGISEKTYYPCLSNDLFRNAYGMDFKDGYVDLSDKNNLKQRLKECIDAPYYEACKYCSRQVVEIPAGEQLE